MIPGLFPVFALLILGLWLIAGALRIREATRRAGLVLLGISLLLFLLYLLRLWAFLERPPLRTLGETRLWYAFFLPIIALILDLRWRLGWFTVSALVMAGLFLGYDLIHPEAFEKELMPALMSSWFVPHVVVYLAGYALLGGATLAAGRGLHIELTGGASRPQIEIADRLVHLGYAFLTLGLLFGAFWAKEAWGHYWSWDPKETWALLTWLVYLGYIHYRIHRAEARLGAAFWLVAGFIILLVAWFGLSALPAARSSVHVYG
jgi:ABC-type transport system involved in cytochrome c biogenesis permease subunit